MKVIRKGPGWKREVKCTGDGNGGGGCESLLEIDKNDVYETRSYDMTGDYDVYYTIKCPVCGVETDIKNLPDVVKTLARTKRLNQHYD